MQPMNAPIAFGMAAASGCLYFLGFTFFRSAAPVLPPLRGTRPVHFGVSVLTNATWLAGGLVMGTGMIMQFTAFALLPLSAAAPALPCGLVVLVMLSLVLPGERLNRVEGGCLALLAAAGVLVTWSGPGTPPPLPLPLLVLVAVPSLVVPVLVFSLGDVRPEGQHARRLTGIAYGLSAGILIGLAELVLLLQAREGIGPDTPASPLPYLFALAVACGIAQLQIAMQRCRMTITVFVATVVAKAYLVVVGGLLCAGSGAALFSAPWLLPPGLVLLAVALLLTPRYETPRRVLPEPAGPSRGETALPGRGPSGTEPAPSRPGVRRARRGSAGGPR